MIEVFKILTGKYDTNVTFTFEKHQDCRTMRHNLKLVNHRCHYDLRKYFFCTRLINTWNSLPVGYCHFWTMRRVDGGVAVKGWG